MLEAQNLNLAATAHVKLAAQRGIVSITVFKNSTAQLQKALGVTLPAMPIYVIADGTTYLWSGPDSWLAIADDPDLLSRLECSVQNLAAVTDQSDGRVIFHVTGESVRQNLAKLIPIDLHPISFPRNATAITLAGHIGIQIWQEEEGPTYALACLRSYAGSLYHSLVEAI